jgi:hypothetical protein
MAALVARVKVEVVRVEGGKEKEGEKDEGSRKK